MSDSQFRSVIDSASSLSVVGTVSHNLHRMRKHALSSFFSKRAVMEYADSIQLCVDKLCARFEEFHTSQSSIELRIVIPALTMDIISLYSYGRSYDCLEKSNFDFGLAQMMASGGELALLLKQCPWIFKIANSLPYWLLARLDPKIMHAVDRKTVMQSQLHIALQDALTVYFQQESEAQIRAIMTNNTRDLQQDRAPNIFQELLNSDVPAEEKSITRLADEGITLLGAGTHTTSHVLSNIVYHILANPNILQTIQKELQEVMSQDSSSAKALLNRLEHLPYFTATITEGFRLSNVASHRNVRIATDRSLRFQNWTIPPGVAVGMTPYMIHMNPDLFPAPQEFRPERWLLHQSNNLELTNESLKKYYMPFGKGSRSCLGMNLVYAEIYLTLAALFRRFELRLFETTRADVDIAHDFIAAAPRVDSKGVRVVIVHKKLI